MKVGCLVLLVMACLLVACGGATTYADGNAVAKAAGLTGCNHTLPFVKPNAACSGGFVYWYTASASDAKRKKEVESGPALDALLLEGDNWDIMCFSMKVCKSARSRIGGRLVVQPNSLGYRPTRGASIKP